MKISNQQELSIPTNYQLCCRNNQHHKIAYGQSVVCESSIPLKYHNQLSLQTNALPSSLATVKVEAIHEPPADKHSSPLQIEPTNKSLVDRTKAVVKEHVGAIHESPADEHSSPLQIEPTNQSLVDSAKIIVPIVGNDLTAESPTPITAELQTLGRIITKFDQNTLIHLEKLETALHKIGSLLANPCQGLLYYQKWWFRSKVDISVNGEKFHGTPIFLHDNTIRLVNDDYSYFVPLAKVDYIRTTDGLKQSI